LRIVQDIDEQDWRDFVVGNSGGNIFQTPEMAKVYEETVGFEAIPMFAIEKGEVQSLVLGNLISDGKGLLRRFTSRCIIQGGPLYSDSAHAATVLGEVDSLVARRALYAEIRNLQEARDLVPLCGSVGFSFEPHLNYIIDLRKDEEELWSNLSKGRRKGISRAEKMGLRIEEAENENQIEVLYDIVRQSYSNLRLPLADRTLFQSAFKILSPLKEVKFFRCKSGSDTIACRAVLLFGKTIYDWYAGSLIEEKGKKPDEYLVWHILKWGMSNGYEVFDFGGAGSPEEEYGPREFKRRFGGKLIEPGRFKKVYKPRQLWMSGKAYELYRRLD